MKKAAKVAGLSKTNHCQGHPPWARMMPWVESVPASSTGIISAMPAGISYEMICAALRMAPNSDHFELDDHPDMMMPTTISAVTARMKKMPMFMSAMTSRWLKGSATKTQANPTIMKYGAMRKRILSDSAGT